MAGSFREMIVKKWMENKFFCLPLDADYEQISPAIRKFLAGMEQVAKETIYKFNKVIIDETADMVCAYSFDLNTYGACARSGGIEALVNSIDYIKRTTSGIPVILDTPMGYGNAANNELLAHTVFKELKGDGFFINPFAGKKALKPLLDRNLKGLIITCYPGEESGREFPDSMVTVSPQRLFELMNGPARSIGRDISEFPETMPLYQYVAHRVANHWNLVDNCWLAFEVNRPDEIEKTRRIVGDLPFFIRADRKDGLPPLVKAALDSNKQGFIASVPHVVLSSRATDFRSVIVLALQEINRTIADALG